MNKTIEERAAKTCAKWLEYCLEIGWSKKHLDDLQRLWWEHHDENGNLIKGQPKAIAGATEAHDDWKRVEDEMRSLLKYIGEKGYYVNDDGSVWKDAFLYGKEIDVVAEYRNLPSPPSNDKP